MHMHMQFLNRSVSHAANVVDTLAAFGLAYSFVKFFVRILQEVKPVGVVLVRDRPQFLKILVCVLVMGGVVSLLTIIICKYIVFFYVYIIIAKCYHKSFCANSKREKMVQKV